MKFEISTDDDADPIAALDKELETIARCRDYLLQCCSLHQALEGLDEAEKEVVDQRRECKQQIKERRKRDKQFWIGIAAFVLAYFFPILWVGIILWVLWKVPGLRTFALALLAGAAFSFAECRHGVEFDPRMAAAAFSFAGLAVLSSIWNRREQFKPTKSELDQYGEDKKFQLTPLKATLYIGGAILLCAGVFVWYGNYFDRFDPPATGNPFDQFDPPAP
jgi:hypothetical protein